jgi:hypothetical protein
MLVEEITTERRRHRRYPFPALIECCRFSDRTNDIFKALVVNAGGGGLCIRLDRAISEGQKIEITKCIYPSLYGTAVVRWLNRTEADSYVAGLSCEPSWLNTQSSHMVRPFSKKK